MNAITALSADVITKATSQHMAFVGKTGSGKTYAAKLFVEKLIREGKRVVILDPTGAWWGLRSGPDGVSPGLPVVIFGGDHADVPITEVAGEALGQLVASSDIRAIIDMSDTTLGARHRFVERFAESVFRSNRQPLYLVIDEADEFAPQSGQPGTERMLGAIDRIVRRGRIKGFRVIMITQRPAVINKNVLSQANTLVAMRLPASQDRAAVELWVKGQADESQAKQMLGSLAKLDRGEGWLWAPESDTLIRTRFPKITTFDSSRTPEDGEAIEAKLMPLSDLSTISTQLAASIDEAKANDPAELRKRIKELEKRLKDAQNDAEIMDSGRVAQLEAVVESMRLEAQANDNRLVATERTLDRVGESLASMRESMMHATGAIIGHREAFRENYPYSPREAQQSGVAQAAGQAPKEPEALPKVPAATPARDRPVRGTVSSDAESLPKGPGLILDAISWWESMGTKRPSRAQVAAVAGYAVGGGSFARYVSELKKLGLVTLSDPGTIEITPAGEEMAAMADTPGSIEELQQRVLGILDAGPMKLLRTLLTHGGKEMGRTQLGELAGYEASGGSFARYMSTLRSLGLIEYPKKTTARPVEWLLRFSSQAAGGGK